MRQFGRVGQGGWLIPAIIGFVSAGIVPGIAAAQSNSDGIAILRSRCLNCHNSQTGQGGLDLTSRESLLRGGERGAAIVPGHSRESLIYQFASRQIRPFMPPAGNPLSGGELNALARWIDSGAVWTDAPGTDGSQTQRPSLFTSTIKPLLERKCLACHHSGPGRAGGLDLTSRQKLM